MVKFKCKHTGNIFTYTMPHDIETMREHGEYEEVKEENVEPEKTQPQKRSYNKRQQKDKL